MTIHRFDVRQALGPYLGARLQEELDFVASLVEQMLFLHEEGRFLQPGFLVTASRAVTEAVMKAPSVEGGAPDRGEIHNVSLGPTRDLTASVVVKQLATLSTGCWVPCIELSKPKQMALLRRSHVAYNSAARLARNSVNNREALFVETLSKGHVRVTSSQLETLDLIANPALRPTPQGDGAIEQFVGLVSIDRGPFPPFATRLADAVRSALDHSHGALFAVARPRLIDSVFAAFETFTRAEPPLDLHAGEMGDRLNFDAITERGTLQIASLLHALTAMDGIVLFSSDGHVHGYRCFVKATGGGPGTGGARRLAYAAVVDRTDLFVGALCRSHDGHTAFRRWDEGNAVRLE